MVSAGSCLRTCRRIRPSCCTVVLPFRADVRGFLDTFDLVAERNHWGDDEAALQLRLALRGPAAENIQGRTLHELREFLLARYGLSADEARRGLRCARLQKGESVLDFGYHLLQLVATAHPHLTIAAREDMATQELIEALGDWHLRREFRLQPATSFSEALKRVQEYNFDRDRGTTQLRYVGAEAERSAPPTESVLEKRVAALGAQQADLRQVVTTGHDRLLHELQGLRSSSRTTQRQGARVGVCFNCGKSGHYQRDCRQPLRRKTPSPLSGNGQGPSA